MNSMIEAAAELLYPDKVRSVSTKFFYQEKNLCFQIMLSYGEQSQIFFKNFEIYEDYRKSHDALVAAINNRQAIPNIFNTFHTA